MVKKTINKNYGLLIIGGLAIISIFLIVTIYESSISGLDVYPRNENYIKGGNVPFEKAKSFEYCSLADCERNCKVYEGKKCVKHKGGSNCLTVYTDINTGEGWNQYWKCE